MVKKCCLYFIYKREEHTENNNELGMHDLYCLRYLEPALIQKIIVNFMENKYNR